jgi:hypothetical protein
VRIAQTNIQLYNQLRRRALDRDELVLVAIVDHLEKYVDLGVLYFGDSAEIVELLPSRRYQPHHVVPDTRNRPGARPGAAADVRVVDDRDRARAA